MMEKNKTVQTNLIEVFICTAEPVAGLLRLMALLSRNRIPLKKLTLHQDKNKNYFEMTVLLESNKENIQKLIKKMEKIIELYKVEMK